MIEYFLAQSPNDEKLWDAKGDYVQIYSGNASITLDGALEAYKKAIECNPNYARAYESIGYYLDVIEDDYEGAEQYFLKALSLDKSKDSYRGLARVLAQQNRIEDALAVLDSESCPYHEDNDIKTLKIAIENGDWSH